MAENNDIIKTDTDDAAKKNSINKLEVVEAWKPSWLDGNVAFAKSNFLVSAKYQMSLLEAKITALAISRLDYAAEHSDGSITVEFKASELARIMGDTSGYFYNTLKDECENAMINGRVIAMVDPERKYFSYIMFITKMLYKDGVLSVEFHRDIRPFIQNLASHFTSYELNTMLSFKSIYSFKLYEILKSKKYASETFVCRLSELILDMGLTDPMTKSMKKHINGKKEPDYDKALEEASNVKHRNWRDFRRWVLDKAVEEINLRTELFVTYEPVTSGKGGKVKYIRFKMQDKNVIDSNAKEINKTGQIPGPVEETGSITPDSSNDTSEIFEEFSPGVLSEIKKILKDKCFDDNSIKVIAKAAEGNIDKINQAYDSFCHAGSIDNVTGWMVAAIKNGYVTNDSPAGRHIRKNAFHNFEERNTDWNALADDIMKNQQHF